MLIGLAAREQGRLGETRFADGFMASVQGGGPM